MILLNLLFMGIALVLPVGAKRKRVKREDPNNNSNNSKPTGSDDSVIV